MTTEPTTNAPKQLDSYTRPYKLASYSITLFEADELFYAEWKCMNNEDDDVTGSSESLELARTGANVAVGSHYQRTFEKEPIK